MDQFHTIRLHGPWQANSELDAAAVQRIKLPLNEFSIDSETAAIGLLLTRKFNWPHVLSEHENVFLNVRANIDLSIELNGQPVVAFDQEQPTSLNELLVQHNELKLIARELSDAISIDIDEVSLKIG